MKYRFARSANRRFRLLAVPAPYNAWLTISNDPDHTTLSAWDELHQLIWQELQLPLSDSFFVVNHNESLPDQVNLSEHPQILMAHAHDTMHTWGDFIHNTKVRFHRPHAVEALELIRRLGETPLIWTDHSGFEGNLIHRASRKPVPESVDSAGHRYVNHTYTLDLIHQAGVRYVWDGARTRIVGQDRQLSRFQHYLATTAVKPYAAIKATADMIGRPLWSAVKAQVFDYRRDDNRQYDGHSFPGDLQFYRFRRYGSWKDADIDGLSRTLSSPFLAQLIQAGGTCVVYTHLGKRKAARMGDAVHVPPDTVAALRQLAKLYVDKKLMLSGTAKLLDYLVLRDHAHLENGIDFRPDGIRFESMTRADLTPHAFAVYSKSGDFDVKCNGEDVQCDVVELRDGIFRIEFPGT